MANDEELAAAIEALTVWEVDSRRITVRLVPDHSSPPVEVWTADLQKTTSGGTLPLDVMAELKVALESEGYPPPYFLDAKRGYTEWGASGVSEQVLLVVGWALAGVAGNATYEALRSAVVRLARDARDEETYAPPNPLGRGEAEERGRWAVRSAFELKDEDADRLAVVGAEGRSGGWVVRYQLADRRYEVELLENDGLVEIARVGWTPPGVS